MLLERVPIDPELRWRGLQLLAHTATGTIVAMASVPAGSPFIASVLLQSSYAFTFTAYDPYTPDPVIFLIAALVLHLWIADRSFVVAADGGGVRVRQGNRGADRRGPGDRGDARGARPPRLVAMAGAGDARRPHAAGLSLVHGYLRRLGHLEKRRVEFFDRLVAGDLVEEQSVDRRARP